MLVPISAKAPMRLVPKSLSIFCLFAAVVQAPAAATAQSQLACAQIKMACQNAGFVQGAAILGIGLQVDCIVPIVSASPQRRVALKPLPQIDPQLIAECAASHEHLARLQTPNTDLTLRPSGTGRPLRDTYRRNDHATNNGSDAAPPHSHVTIPQADLLERPAAPDCEFKSDTQADNEAALRAMKLDYEAQCHRQSEFILRARMERLQDAVRSMIESLKAENLRTAK
jgi:hypothetical protein